MRNLVRHAAPALLLGIGAALLLGVDRQAAETLRAPLASLPRSIDGFVSVDRFIGEEERRVAGMDEYLLREYREGSGAQFSVYVGYYQQQTRGRTIHSPKNCLPGAGWEPVSVSDRDWLIGTRTVRIRRYVLAKEASRAIVYYWYQGRGRVASNEYKVKWELLRDAALFGRTEEALVRLVIPLTGTEAAADALAWRVGTELIPEVDRTLPAWNAGSRVSIVSSAGWAPIPDSIPPGGL